MRTSMAWEFFNCHWTRVVGGPMTENEAWATAELIRDPVSDDDDAHEAQTFTCEAVGSLGDVAGARVKAWICVRGRRLLVTKVIRDGMIEVYDPKTSRYETIAQG